MNFTWIIALIGLTFGQLPDAKLYEVNEGSVYFRSDAPLELIEASSTELKGLINAEERTFAFSVPMSSFEGFNSPLQRVHFNENYMESKQYPNATFSGKIIENIDFTKDGLYTVRAKGQLNVHGIKRERIIRSELQVEEGQIEVHANFTVLLAEHDISIPKIVHQKIAEEIAVEIRAVFLPKTP
ncbi:YceI family protein [Phaeodactylibacter xiamenensis]|uniref:YceI family protein n=1 Tax=Phaeodactylibacter xiamenensis TaxID=1524460 RepID=UPI003CCB828A